MQLFSITDCARIVGIDEGRIHYAHRSGKISDPSHFVAGKRIYTEADVQRVADFFGVRIKNKHSKDKENTNE